MSTSSFHSPTYRRDLGAGLVLRWSTVADVERITDLYSHVFRENAEEPLNRRIVAWTRDMMSGRHPLLGPGDFALVEDTERGAVVAATCLMETTWQYGEIPFSVGRPEIVATHPDYRNRGLIRAIFELIHARSTARGHLVQGITGIYYYYRQFGYEYALDLGGSRSMYFASIPKLKEGQPEPYTLRDATANDLPLVASLYDHERADRPVSTHIDAAYWRYVLEDVDPEAGEGWHTKIIQDAAGQAVGYVLTTPVRYSEAFGIKALAVKPGISLAATLPAVLRALRVCAENTPGFKADAPPAGRLAFLMGRTHPVYDVLGDLLSGRSFPPYAWYVRVPDMPAFIRRIAPVLEQRLVGSVVAGHTGEIKLNFYRDGLRLAFEGGRLTTVEPWRAQVWGPEADGGFPPLVFLQLLFGHRSLDELRYAYADAFASDAAQPVIEALFPARPAWVLSQE